jgi:tetratricopeptide (TPR) repeat protein
LREGNRSYNILLILLLLVTGYSCSVEKNTNLSRFYHNLVSQYNIYFNGKESFNAGMEKIVTSNRDDYTKIMPLFEYSNPLAVRSSAGNMDRAIQKASKVISLHSMTAKPKKKNNKTLSDKEKAFQSKKDYNNWVDDSYLLLGMAQHMKHDFENARVTFLHNIRESDDGEMRDESRIWLAKAYAEMRNYAEGRRVLSEINIDKLSDRLKADNYLTQADIYMKEDRYIEAIVPLKTACDLMKGNSPKNRYVYILARLYEETGNSSQAGETYKDVLKLNPEYELEFNSRINQAGVFDVESGDIDDIERELSRLLKDSKNMEYQDQIYYALGNLSMRKGDIEQAIKYIKQSAAISTNNSNQKGKSYLSLAEYYFNENEYLQSQVYYDSAVTFLDQDYPGFDAFYDRSINLNELAGYITTVSHEDSLQYVASLPEAQQMALIDGIIRKIEDEEMLAEGQTDDRYNMGQFYEDQRRYRDNANVSGKWYFYNQATLTFGRTEFKNRWGKRKLEDNWRRGNRASINSMGMIDEMESQASDSSYLKGTENKSPEYYLRDLPLTDSLVVLSNDKIANSLFFAARLFSIEFEDDIKANESYSDLLERFPDHPLIPQALYNCYIINKDHNTVFANSKKEELVSRFPESDYSKILSDPDYYEILNKKNEEEENLYHRAYLNWENGNMEQAALLCETGISDYPDGELMAKFMLLRVYSIAQTIDERSLKQELQEVSRSFPGTDESKRADELIAYLNKEVPDLKLEEEVEIARDIYLGDASGQHHFVIIIKDSKLDINRLTFDVINFNIDNYTNENYSSRGQLIDDSYIMITVGPVADEFIAADYYNQFDYLKVLNNIGATEVITFTITPANLEVLMNDKDPDRYYLFFKENYLDIEE